MAAYHLISNFLLRPQNSTLGSGTVTVRTLRNLADRIHYEIILSLSEINGAFAEQQQPSGSRRDYQWVVARFNVFFSAYLPFRYVESERQEIFRKLSVSKTEVPKRS